MAPVHPIDFQSMPHAGFLLVDKPQGPSSFNVVAAVRRTLKIKKVGHAGTLDPAASGLLVIAFGAYTRLLPYLPLEPKTYSFCIRFGVETDTLDATGVVIKTSDQFPSRSEIEAALPAFFGILQQIPPQYAAIKIGGEHAYALARKGEHVDLAPREIEVFSLALTGYDETAKSADFEVVCAGGTYVRSLARDIAAALGTCGHADSIRRRAAGVFDVRDSLVCTALENAPSSIVSAAKIFAGTPGMTLSKEQVGQIATGGNVRNESGNCGDVVIGWDDAKQVVAVLKYVDEGWYHPERVFTGS